MHTIIGYCYKWSAPCQQNLSFTRSILAYLRKTLHESSKIFVENVWHVARIYFYTQAYMIVIPMHYSDHSYTEDHQFINNRCSYSKNQFDKRKQDWLVQNSGCSEFKGLTRCRQSFLSPSPDQREDKKGFVCRVFVLVHKYTKKGLPQYSKSWSHATVKNTYRGSTEAVTLYT